MIINERWWRASLRTLERHLYHTVIDTFIEIRLSLGRIIQCSRYLSNILRTIFLDLNLTAQEFRPRLMLTIRHPWRRSLFYLLLHRWATSLPAYQLFALLKNPSDHLFHQLLLLLEASSVHLLARSALLLLSSSSLDHSMDCFCIHTPYLNSYLWGIILEAKIVNLKEYYY